LEAFATGEYTLTKIQSKMFSLGLVSKDGKPLHLSTIQGILANPFYYGYFKYRGELHQGSHKPMISKKLFDQIQQALISNGKPRKKRGPKNFLFLNFAVCGECGYSITAERHIKKSGLKFVYYRCTHKSKTQKCSQRSFLREEKFAEQIKEQCQKVSLPDVWRDRFLNKLKEWENENRQTSDFFAQNLKTELEKVKTKINRLMDAYLEGDLELPEFQMKKNDLMSEKKTLEEKLSGFERKGNHWLELTKNWILEANQAKNFVLNASTTYYFQVRSQDPAGNTATDNNSGNYYTFTSLKDTTPPTISGVTWSVVSDTKATIIWNTDELSTSQVVYGTSISYGASTTEDTTLTIQHSVTLTGLTKETTYYYKVISKDAANNQATDNNSGAGYTFTTTKEPGEIVTVGGGVVEVIPEGYKTEKEWCDEMNLYWYDGACHTEPKVPPEVPEEKIIAMEEKIETEVGTTELIKKASQTFVTEIIKALPHNPFIKKLPEETFIASVTEIAPKGNHCSNHCW